MENYNDRRTQGPDGHGRSFMNGTPIDHNGYNDHQKYSSSFTDLVRPEYDLQTRSEFLRSDIAENFRFQNSLEGNKSVPIEIQYSPGKGRFLVALRDISAGEVLLKESPLLLAPKPGSDPVCLACLRALRGKWVLCEKCSGPLCSHKCEGVGHSTEECILIERLGLNASTDITNNFKKLSVLLGPLKMFVMMRENSLAREMINAFQSHKDRRRSMPIGRFIEDKIVRAFQSQLGLDDADSNLIHHLCGVLDTNAFDVSVDDVSHARALFPLSAMMNHSCLPNTQHWYSGGEMVVRAASDIPMGAPVTTTYTQTLWGSNTRSTHLLMCKMFSCICDRCQDPTELGSHLSSIICKECQVPEALLLPSERANMPWKCCKCNTETPADAIQTMVRASSAMFSRIDSDNIEETSAVLRHLSRMLGRQHYIVTQLKYSIIQTIMKKPLGENTIENDELTWVMELTEELLKLAEQIEPELSRFRGLLQFYRGRAYLELLKRSTLERNNVITTDNDTSSCGNGKGFHNVMSEKYLKEMIGRMAECEFILLYDSKLPEVINITQQLREFLSLDTKE